MHFHLCVPTLVCICSYICMYYLCVPVVFMHVYLPQHILCSFTNTFTVFVIWGPCWAGCAILFSGLPSLPSAPQILLHPYDVWNVTGQDVIFGCEVFAYPMASIEWRKDGLDIQLPGDDPHISVQVGAGS